MSRPASEPGPRQWTAERPVDAARATQLVGRAFPPLPGLPVVPLGEGWDNTVHLVGGRWVFRFPRRAGALAGFDRERAVLPRIASRLPLPVPVPEWQADDDVDADPWPFTGSPLLTGCELAEAGLRNDDRQAAAGALGRLLRVLHDPATLDVVADLHLPVDPTQRGWPAARMADTRERLRRLQTAGLWPGDGAVDGLLAKAERLLPPAGTPVLTHGDLHARHLLVDGDGAAVGVLDWGDVCRADPGVDLSIAYGAFAGPARAALLHAYGPVGGDGELRARALAIRLSAMLATYGAEDGRPALLAEALAGLARAVA